MKVIPSRWFPKSLVRRSRGTC